MAWLRDRYLGKVLYAHTRLRHAYPPGLGILYFLIANALCDRLLVMRLLSSSIMRRAVVPGMFVCFVCFFCLYCEYVDVVALVREIRRSIMQRSEWSSQRSLRPGTHCCHEDVICVEVFMYTVLVRLIFVMSIKRFSRFRRFE